jgi:hypothetical protein
MAELPALNRLTAGSIPRAPTICACRTLGVPPPVQRMQEGSIPFMRASFMGESAGDRAGGPLTLPLLR